MQDSEKNTVTHVALLTPAGRGAVATIAVFGPNAVAAVDCCFRAATGRPLTARAMGEICYGRWQDASTGEEVVVSRRESHVVEIHCHGGEAAPGRILADLQQAGCKQVEWKRWAREQSNDSLAVDALATLADARSERTATILLDQLSGALRSELCECVASLASGQLAEAAKKLGALIQRGPLGLHLVEPWRVVIAGAPNMGKSSLLNAIVGYDRSIVVGSPGTTRDVVATATVIDGWPVLLADTAGLRKSDDEIETAGVLLAEKQLAAAELVVLLFDRSQNWSAADDALAAAWPQAMIVENKCDLPAAEQGNRAAGIKVSATTKQGLPQLLAAMSERLVRDIPPIGAGVPFTRSQINTIQAAAEAIERGDALLASRELNQLLIGHSDF